MSWLYPPLIYQVLKERANMKMEEDENHIYLVKCQLLKRMIMFSEYVEKASLLPSPEQIKRKHIEESEHLKLIVNIRNIKDVQFKLYFIITEKQRICWYIYIDEKIRDLFLRSNFEIIMVLKVRIFIHRLRQLCGFHRNQTRDPSVAK